MLPLFCHIVEVKEVESQSNAMSYLERGWVLLCVAPYNLNDEGRFRYSLGRPDDVSPTPELEEEVKWHDEQHP